MAGNFPDSTRLPTGSAASLISAAITERLEASTLTFTPFYLDRRCRGRRASRRSRMFYSAARTWAYPVLDRIRPLRRQSEAGLIPGSLTDFPGELFRGIT